MVGMSHGPIEMVIEKGIEIGMKRGTGQIKKLIAELASQGKSIEEILEIISSDEILTKLRKSLNKQ